MNTAPSLFDYAAAEEMRQRVRALESEELAKQEGIDRAESRDPTLADLLRGRARLIALETGRVTIDDVREWMDSRGIIPPSTSFLGCVFRGSEWEIIGYEKSSRPGKKAHRQPVWGIKRSAS